MESAHPTFTLVLAIAAGVLAQSLARHLRLPGIVLLLLAGATLGPDGLGWVQPRALGEGLFAIVDLAVAVILFEGGLNLQISRLRREQAAIRRLVTWSALVTLCGGMLAARLLLEWSWVNSLLFGSLVVVTGPTVIGPLVTELRLRPRVATLLNAEGVLIDPIGAILAVLVLELALAPHPETIATGARDLVLRMGFGASVGISAGFLLSRLLRIRRLVPEGYENIFVLAAVLVLFQGCDQVVSHSGILAVTLAGVVVGNLRILADRDLREFKDQLTVLLVGLLFVMLAADVRFAEVRALGLPALGVVAALVLLVRPLGVWLATMGTEFTIRERLFVSWIAPRGIVAAAVASVVAGALESSGLEGGSQLRALVFLTIAATVLLAGLTAYPVASWLGVRLPSRDTVAILGAQGLGLALGGELKAAGVPVVFLDSNPQSCRRAEEAGFTVVFGNGIEERTMQRARLEGVGVAVALTPNQTVNSVFVSRARDFFRVPSGYVAGDRVDTGLASELLRSGDAKALFEGPHDVERWDVRSHHGGLDLQHRVFQEPEQGESEDGKKENPPIIGERFAILAVRRGKRILPMSPDYEAKPGDIASIAVHVPDRKEAEALMQKLGWMAVVEESKDGETSS
ncbi:MAG: cation:proton antiporter [Myxococcota bacterium]